MSEEELRIQKLQIEIKELSKSNWRKPAGLTIIISAITVTTSAYFGFAQYFKQVDQDNITKIENLEREQDKVKAERRSAEIEKHNAEIAKSNYELLLQQNETRDIANKLKLIHEQFREKEKQLSNLKKELNGIKSVEEAVNKYNDYILGYAQGIIRSPSGQNKMESILGLENDQDKKMEIEKFAFNVTQQAHLKTMEEILGNK